MVVMMMNMLAKQLAENVIIDLKGKAIFMPLETQLCLLQDKPIIAQLNVLPNIIIKVISLQVII
jgi:hypothetical protein